LRRSSALAASIAGDAPFDLEFRIALKDGTQRWLYSRGAVSRDASGKAVRMYGASIDVTERKRADEKLRESEERLRRAIEIETVGVIFFKTDGSITKANDAFLRMSGYTREDLAEGLVRWDVMTPPEWMPHSSKAIEEFKSTGRTVPYEKEYLRKDGSQVWLAWKAVPVLEESLIYATGRDITERKRAEEALRRRDAILRAVAFAAECFLKMAASWEGSIEEVLERLGRAAEASRVYVFENYTGTDGERWTAQRYEWVAPGVSAQIDNPSLKAFPYRAAGFDRWMETLGRGNLVYGHTRTFPEGERLELRSQDIESIMTVPIFVEGAVVGEIDVDGSDPAAFDETDARFLEEVAALLGPLRPRS
jgi:PAS domain S-box-containing protein